MPWKVLLIIEKIVAVFSSISLELQTLAEFLGHDVAEFAMDAGLGFVIEYEDEGASLVLNF